jgi:hypothetical protein
MMIKLWCPRPKCLCKSGHNGINSQLLTWPLLHQQLLKVGNFNLIWWPKITLGGRRLVFGRAKMLKFSLKKNLLRHLNFGHAYEINCRSVNSLLEILGFATVACNWNSVACDTCNCKFVQLHKTSCTWHAVACDSTSATCIYGVSIHVHTYIPI